MLINFLLVGIDGISIVVKIAGILSQQNKLSNNAMAL